MTPGRAEPPTARFLRAAAVAAVLLDSPAAAEDVRALFARGGEAMRGGRFEEALDAYTLAAAAATGPEGRANAGNGAGFALLKLRRYDEAAERLAAATALSPKLKVAWNNLGLVRLKQYETGLAATTSLDSALTAFGTVAALDPAHRPDNLAVAKAYADQEGAWAMAAAARAGQPPRTPAATGAYTDYRRAGDDAEREGDLAFARANWERAEAVAPSKKGKGAAANMQGLLALRQREPRAAIDALKRATTLDPASKFAWNNYGVALMRGWDANVGGRELVEAAVDALRRARALDAGYKPANLAWGEEVLAELNAATVSATVSR